MSNYVPKPLAVPVIYISVDYRGEAWRRISSDSRDHQIVQEVTSNSIILILRGTYDLGCKPTALQSGDARRTIDCNVHAEIDGTDQHTRGASA